MDGPQDADVSSECLSSCVCFRLLGVSFCVWRLDVVAVAFHERVMGVVM
jgi:hypothetical protein